MITKTKGYGANEVQARWDAIVDALEAAGIPLDELSAGAIMIGAEGLRKAYAGLGVDFVMPTSVPVQDKLSEFDQLYLRNLPVSDKVH